MKTRDAIGVIVVICYCFLIAMVISTQPTSVEAAININTRYLPVDRETILDSSNGRLLRYDWNTRKWERSILPQ